MPWVNNSTSLCRGALCVCVRIHRQHFSRQPPLPVVIEPPQVSQGNRGPLRFFSFTCICPSRFLGICWSFSKYPINTYCQLFPFGIFDQPFLSSSWCHFLRSCVTDYFSRHPRVQAVHSVLSEPGQIKPNSEECGTLWSCQTSSY